MGQQPLIVLGWDNAGLAPTGWGSHVMLAWCDWEPRAGVFDYARVEKALNAAERPCFLQIGFSMYHKTLRAPVDYTPQHMKRTIALQTAGGVTGYVPDYSAAWVDGLVRATVALAERFKGHPNVKGFWVALGWDQESQAAVDNSGGPWAALLKGRLAEQTYLDFLLRYSRVCRDAWAPKTVYLPAAPSPGALWGHRRRDVIATLLADGCGYMNCGLMPDFSTSYGVGEYVGTGLHDIVLGRTARVGYEEGPRRAYGDPGELYWMLLRIWGRSDFLCVYGSLSGKQVDQVLPAMPQTARWFAWRDAEGGKTTWKGPDGKLYGTAYEPGCWGQGLAWRTGGKLRFDGTRYDFGRHCVVATEMVGMDAPGLADGRYRVTAYAPPNLTGELIVEVKDGAFALPAGTYHRIDLHEPAIVEPAQEPLPNDEPTATPTKVRWWIEEYKRALEAGREQRARAILVSLIELAYRLERRG